MLFVKDGQIYRATVTPARPASERDRGEKPFIKEWGVQSAPKWSPDGRKIAFVSTRTDHSFVAVYDVAARAVKYMAPSVDFDTSPMWTADSKSIVFVRRPGSAVRSAGAAGRRRDRRAERSGVSDPLPDGRGGRGGRRRAPAPAGTRRRRQPAGAVAKIPGLRRRRSGAATRVGVEGGRRDGRRHRGLAQPAERPHVHHLHEPAAGRRLT